MIEEEARNSKSRLGLTSGKSQSF